MYGERSPIEPSRQKKVIYKRAFSQTFSSPITKSRQQIQLQPVLDDPGNFGNSIMGQSSLVGLLLMARRRSGSGIIIHVLWIIMTRPSANVMLQDRLNFRFLAMYSSFRLRAAAWLIE
jgi:hypothetical protein